LNNHTLQIFIDRDPVFFSKILNYLRTKDIDLRFVLSFLLNTFIFAAELNSVIYVYAMCIV